MRPGLRTFLTLSRYNAAEFAKSSIRMALHAPQLTTVRLRPGLRTARVVVALTVKNEAPRFPYLLEYYRQIGVDHFLVVDNESEDALAALLDDEPDVSIFRAKGSFRKSRFGNDWINLLLTLHCRGKWVLYIDADELFTWDTAQAPTLPEFCALLERAGRRSVQSMMLDMYSDTVGTDSVVGVGQDPLEVCDRFDASGYERHYDPISQTTWIKGGVRGRVFFPDNIWRGPALNKTPLVRWRAGYAFIQAAHKLWPRSLNQQDDYLGGAILHFKFTSLAVSKITADDYRREHTAEYDAYQHTVHEVVLATPDSARYAGPKSLVETRIIGASRFE